MPGPGADRSGRAGTYHLGGGDIEAAQEAREAGKQDRYPVGAGAAGLRRRPGSVAGRSGLRRVPVRPGFRLEDPARGEGRGGRRGWYDAGPGAPSPGAGLAGNPRSNHLGLGRTPGLDRHPGVSRDEGGSGRRGRPRVLIGSVLRLADPYLSQAPAPPDRGERRRVRAVRPQHRVAIRPEGGGPGRAAFA